MEPEEHGWVPVDPEHEALRLGLREAGHLAVEAGLPPGHLLHIEHHRPAHNTTDGILEWHFVEGKNEGRKPDKDSTRMKNQTK